MTERSTERPAARPAARPARRLIDWQTARVVLAAIVRRASTRSLSVHAAGIALFALLGAVPVMSSAVAIYALLANPTDVAAQLADYANVFPPPVFAFFVDSLTGAAKTAPSELRLTLIVSVVVALFAARHCADALIEGLNVAYARPETRHRFRRLVASLGAAGVALLTIVLVTTFVVAAPTVIAFAIRSEELRAQFSILRWGVLVATMTGLLLWLYRRGPAPQPGLAPRHVPRLWPGAITGTLLWLFSSWGLSQWIARAPRFSVLYGAFTSLVVLLLWSYLAALSVLIGAVVNAELPVRANR